MNSKFFIEKKTVENLFIGTVCEGYILIEHNIRFCLCSFDTIYYNQNYFDHYNIFFPDILRLASTSRCAEYLAGRHSASKLLKHFGFRQFALLNAGDRSPQWPGRLCGSLSHSKNHAITILAEKNKIQYLGVDIEEIIKTDYDIIAKTTMSDNEKKLLSRTNLTWPQQVTIAFSAKESTFKALYPSVKCFFDFSCVEIVALKFSNIDTGTITIELKKDISPFLRSKRNLYGIFKIYSENIITLIVN